MLPAVGRQSPRISPRSLQTHPVATFVKDQDICKQSNTPSEQMKPSLLAGKNDEISTVDEEKLRNHCDLILRVLKNTACMAAVAFVGTQVLTAYAAYSFVNVTAIVGYTALTAAGFTLGGELSKKTDSRIYQGLVLATPTTGYMIASWAINPVTVATGAYINIIGLGIVGGVAGIAYGLYHIGKFGCEKVSDCYQSLGSASFSPQPQGSGLEDSSYAHLPR